MMRWIERIAAIGLVSLVGAVAGSQTGLAQSFEISQNGKSVGKANLKVDKSAAGFDATSDADIKMPGLTYKFSEKQSLDAGYRLTKVELKGDGSGLRCVSCHRLYPIRDEIPVMLIDEATIDE